MNDEIRELLMDQGVDIIRFVDIRCFPKEQTLGFEKAIIFCMILSKKYLTDGQ